MTKTVAVILFCLSLLGLPDYAAAGQVVTSELQAWAREVVSQEKNIATIAQGKSIAVLYYENSTGDTALDPLQKGLTLMLITDLAKIDGLEVVERVRLQAIIEEMKLATSGLMEANTAPRLGHLLRARWIAGGKLTGKSETLAVHSRVLTVVNEQLLGEPVSQGSLAGIFELEKDALFKIVQLLQLKPTPEEMEELKKPMSSSVDALMALFRGIDASDRRRYADAARFYEKALEKDPQLETARTALEELRRLGLIFGQLRTRHFLRSLNNYTSLTNSLVPKYPVKRMRTPKDILAVESDVGIIPPNLPPDFGAPTEPDRPVSPPDNLPGVF